MNKKEYVKRYGLARWEDKQTKHRSSTGIKGKRMLALLLENEEAA